MNLKRSPFSILNKERREIDYIKGVYKRKIKDELFAYYFLICLYRNVCETKSIFSNKFSTHFNPIQIQLLILYPYMGVPQTVHIFSSDSLSD